MHRAELPELLTVRNGRIPIGRSKGRRPELHRGKISDSRDSSSSAGKAGCHSWRFQRGEKNEFRLKYVVGRGVSHCSKEML